MVLSAVAGYYLVMRRKQALQRRVERRLRQQVEQA
jgi:hypothetical protein